MDTVYWVALLVGGFFVVLSMLGGGDADGDLDMDADTDLELDADAELGAGPGFIDLFSLRTLFLFAAFFGLCGVLLALTDVSEVLRAVLAISTGAFVGLGGNYVIKRVGYAQISSTVTSVDMKGKSGHVVIPFGPTDKGKIVLRSKGQRLQLIARAFEEAEDSFEPGDEVVVVRVDGGIAEVVKPS